MPIGIETHHTAVGLGLLVGLAEADTGKYDWIVGAEGDSVVDKLRKNITEKKLQDLVFWHETAYRFPSVFKPELIK
jgi:hypothetical protein